MTSWSTEETPPAAEMSLPRPDAIMEELEQRIISLGGRELSPEEARDLNAKVRWADIPGEPAPA
jgi:hypothetical protein